MPDERTHKRVNLSAIQVIAGSLAAVTSALVASYLGPAGTLVGAAGGSVIATVGGAVYAHYLDRTHHRLKSVILRPAANGRGRVRPPGGHPAAAPEETVTEVRPAVPAAPPDATAAADLSEDEADQPTLDWLRARRLRLGISAVVCFGVALMALTGVEAAIGKTISGILRGTQDTGTSVGQVFRPGENRSIPSPRPTSRPSPEETSRSERTPTGAPTLSPTQPDPTATNTPVPSVAPTAVVPPSPATGAAN